MPSDIDPSSGMRLPLPNREDLDEAGKKAYDRGATPGASIAGLQGPAGIQLFSPKTAANVSALNRYLRFEAGFTGHVREVAILATAREMDSQFEWVAHEPEALKEGVPQQVIDVGIVHHEHAAGTRSRLAFAVPAVQQVAHLSRSVSSQYEIAARCIEQRSDLAVEVRRTQLLQFLRELLERQRQWNLRLERLHG